MTPTVRFSSKTPAFSSTLRVEAEISNGAKFRLNLETRTWFYQTTPCCRVDFYYKEERLTPGTLSAFCFSCDRQYSPRDHTGVPCTAEGFSSLFTDFNPLDAMLYSATLALKVEQVMELPLNHRDDFEGGLPLMSGPL